MAIVTDPDVLDRDQVIFGTTDQKLSLYPVGSTVHANASASTGSTNVGTTTFKDTATAGFVTWGVTAGDILTLRNGEDARHFIVSAVTNASALEVQADEAFTTFAATASALSYAIHEASTGTIGDGVSKQALYSFGKEEWRADAFASTLGDDLIRHEFPLEPITSEQMEMGGGVNHANWDYTNDYTRKKIRTGGWAAKDSLSSTLTEYTGIISLGAIDADAQVYFQQSSAGNSPTDFNFLGGVNEPILTLVSTVTDYRNYLKLFVRKKGKTYAQSEIADIGVTQIQTIVNRFPLTHADDAAITDNDSVVFGLTPFYAAATVVTDTDGVASTAVVSAEARGVFRDPNATTLTSTVVAGDTLSVNTGVNTGKFTIVSVVNASTLSIDISEASSWSDGSALDYDVLSKIITANKTGGTATNIEDMALAAGASAGVAIASSNTATFVTDGVASQDILAIMSTTTDHEGMYTIVSVVSETTLLVNSSDNPFTVVTGVDFQVRQPGMYLQYKKEDITISAHGSVHFASAGNTIVRDTGTWSGDGVTEGTVFAFASTVSNNRSYTVATVTNASTVVLVSADSTRIKDEVIVGASTTAYDAFKRTINGRTYAFNWRLSGNGATAINCYQFVQHQLRQPSKSWSDSDINWGELVSRGDVTDLLMSYATPTGTTVNLIIDNIHADDTNNVTYNDASGVARVFPFVSSFTINHNSNMQNDANTKVRMFFSTNPQGNYSTASAVTVQNATGSAVAYTVGGAGSYSDTFDYDGNVQGGRAAAADASVTIVGIGLNTAQFVRTDGLITRAKGLSFSLVSPLERNYSNP